MQKYLVDKRSAPFLQGLVFGLIFGTLGALLMLGRRGRDSSTL